MSKRTFSWMNPAVFVAAFLLISNLAYGQEGMMKGKHEEGALHEESQEHHWGKGHPGMMEGIHQMGMMHKGMGKHQCGMGCRGMMEGEHGGLEFFIGMRDELELTEGQIEKLRTLKSKTKKQAIRTRADLDVLEIELHDLLWVDKVDVEAVDAKIEKMGELQTKMHKSHIHARLDAQKILTPEQLRKHRQMKERRKHGMRMRGEGAR